MDLVKALLLEVDTGGIASNPFVTDETETAYKNYVDRFIFTTNEHTKEQLAAEADFLNAIMVERENSFKIGFKTALELIFFGGGKCNLQANRQQNNTSEGVHKTWIG